MYSKRNEKLYYSSPAEVITLNGLKYGDYNFETEEDFDTYIIDTYLTGIKDFIDTKVIDFSTLEKVPYMVHMLALQICSEYLSSGLIKHQSPTVSTGDIPTMVNIKILTPDTKELFDTLTRKYKKRTISFDTLGADLNE